MEIIGRKREKALLQKAYDSDSSEFIAVYGRRRVGKTYLVREFFRDKITFYATGIARGTKAEQMTNFFVEITKINDDVKASVPSTWFEIFELLSQSLEKIKGKKVLFLDEMPWMDTAKSDFLKALERFWNVWASARTDILLIVCGSAASWMVNNVIMNDGGLHNRLTNSIHLQPFSLNETREFLQHNNVKWENSMIAECYMIIGGIPYYLRNIDGMYSLAQNVDNLFFMPGALLRNEFNNLFHSLFNKSEYYVKIVEVLSKKKSGFTRDEISEKSGISNGGGLTRLLTTLEQCGFIRQYKSLGATKNVYQLIDFYCLFYYSFVKGKDAADEATWMHLQNTPTHNTWKGLSFERLCMSHSAEIRKALGISGIMTHTYTYYTSGVQIDMVIERGDNAINLCEMKYSNQPYSITKSEAEKIQKRISALQEKTKHKKTIFFTLVTPCGLNQNKYSINLVQNVITLDDLFA